MNLTIEAIVFISIWIIWCSLPFITPRALNLLPKLKADTLFWRIAEWHIRFPALIAIGYIMDTLYSNRPHESYSAPEFYAILYTSSLVFSVPAIIYYLAHHKKLSL